VQDVECNTVLTNTMAACDTAGTGSLAQCCALIPQLWATFADDDNLCLCSSQFRQKDQVRAWTSGGGGAAKYSDAKSRES
jgi:hypothetical protein